MCVGVCEFVSVLCLQVCVKGYVCERVRVCV